MCTGFDASLAGTTNLFPKWSPITVDTHKYGCPTITVAGIAVPGLKHAAANSTGDILVSGFGRQGK
jgi:hypothetical protein